MQAEKDQSVEEHMFGYDKNKAKNIGSTSRVNQQNDVENVVQMCFKDRLSLWTQNLHWKLRKKRSR